MKNLRKILRQNVATLPKQSLTGLKFALGVRAQYMTIIGLGVLMATQIAGVVIFSGGAKAIGSIVYDRSITTKKTLGIGHVSYDANFTLAKDSLGNVYVGDSINHLIKKYTPDGVFITEWGSVGDGVGQFDQDGSPRRLAVDASDNVYAIDGGHNRILKFTSTGGYIGQIGSTGTGNGQFNFFGPNGWGIGGLDFDTAGNIYVADSGNARIQKLNPSGGYIKQWQDHDFDTPDSDIEGSVDNIVVSSSNEVYVSVDRRALSATYWRPRDPLPSVIEHFDSDGNYQGYFEVEAANHYETGGLDTDSSGNIYVASGPNVDKFNASGLLQHTWTNTATNVPPSPASSVVVDASNSIYTLDGEDIGYYAQPYVKKMDSSGAVLATFSNGADGVLGNASSIAKGPDGSIYVVACGDLSGEGSTGSRIQKFDSSGKFVRSWHGGFMPANSGGGSYYGSFGQIAVGPDGDVYAFTESGITEFSSDGVAIRQLPISTGGSADGQFGSQGPGDMAIAPNGEIYIADPDNHRIQVFSSTGLFQRAWGSLGYNYYDNSLQEPKHVAVSPSGLVYVGDVGSGRIKKFDSVGNIISSFHVGVYGDHLGALSVDRNGRLFVVRTNTKSIIVIAADDSVITSWGSSGTGDGQFSGGDNGQFSGGVIVGVDNQIYALDVGGARVEIFNDNSFDLRVTTNAASNINQTAARLNLTSSDLTNMKDANYTFEYGATTSYGSTVSSDSTTSTTGSPITLIGGPTVYQAGNNQGRDKHGNFYITPNGNLYKFNSAGQYVGRIGYENHFYGSYSTSMAFDSEDNVYYSGYIAGDGTGVEKYDSSGNFLGVLSGSSTGFNRLATDNQDNLYVLTSTTVYKYDSTGALVHTYILPEPTSMYCGGNIVVDSSGYMYVIDASDCGGGGTISAVMRKISPNGEVVGQWSSPASFNLYIDANDLIYVAGRTVFTTTGATVTTSGPLANTGTYAISLLGVDVATGKAFGMSSEDVSVSTYTRQGYANISGLSCNTTYHFRAIAQVGGDTVYGEDQSFVTAACPGQFAIATTSLPDGVVGQSYSQPIQVENSSGPVSYAFMEGSNVPPGLTVDVLEPGAVAGTPTAPGTYTFTIEASSGASSDAQEYTMTVTEADIPMTITTDTLPMGYTGQPYSAAIETAHAHGDRTFTSIADALPAGLELNASTGEITGTPASWTGGRYYNLRIEVTDGVTTIYQDYSLYIEEVGTVYICDSDYNETLRLNRQFSRSICTSGGLGYKTFEVVSGSLPPGLSLDAISGEISGAATQVGDYDAVIRVSDLSGSDEIAFHGHVIPDPEPKANTPIVTITSPTNNAVFDYKHDTVVVSGTGPANQTIATYMDGYQLGTADVDDGGNWSYKVSNVFPGNHAFDAKWVPSGDIAFVPYYDINSFNSNIYSIDTASKQLIAIYHLPSYCGAVSAVINHAGNKLYVSGIDQSVFKPAIWEYDISSGELTGHMLLDDPEGYYSGMAVSDDDHYIYAKKNSLNDGSSGENAPARYHKIDIKTMSYAGALPDLTPINRRTGISMVKPVLAAGYLYSTDSVTDGNDPYTISAINIINQSITSIGTISGAARLDNLPQIAIADYIYASVNDRLVVIDPGTNMVTKELSIPGIQENHDSSDDMVVSMAIDAAHQKAYLVTYLRKLYVVDITSGDVTSYEVSPEEVINDYSQSLLNSATLSSDGSHLYIVDIGFGKIRSFNISAQAFEPAISGILPVDRMGYIANGDYIGRIAPPTANISFSVGAAPIRPTIEPKPEPQSTPPTTTLETHQPIITKEAPASSLVTTPKGVVFAQNNLFALVRRIPEPIAIGFPWLLLLLALILVVIQYYHVHFEAIATKNLQQALAAQQRLVEEQDNFVALTTHYLHTPLTVMEGEISLMLKTGTISQEHANKLNAALASLSAEAESVLAQEEHDEVE